MLVGSGCVERTCSGVDEAYVVDEYDVISVVEL